VSAVSNLIDSKSSADWGPSDCPVDAIASLKLIKAIVQIAAQIV
jgi:hypothetical protein